MFCTESLTYSGGVRYHSPEYVRENVELLIGKFRCNAIAFFDNDFLADRNCAVNILESLIAAKLNRQMKFGIQSRVNQMDRELAQLLKKAGCVKVEFGLETGDEGLLNRINKNATIDEAERAVGICRDYGISVQANLMMGFEGETLEMLERTISWVKKLKADNFSLSMVELYPGSKLYQEKGKRFIEESDWSRENINQFFATDHLSPIPLQERKDWQKKKVNPYKRYLHHKSILKNNSLLNCLKYYPKELLSKWRSR